ncbi:DUF4190 domain-containing protein [Demequina activiva]|uniref:DUF4190 domain-containing protein n=1 Tax=Demequina activiva TaxID=1582364 RepID=A0A919Q288_9MICO|nr:DUF4190 domain-containing protein [Demequina activiva]GIG53556.1 hypothetical protein Dac01nite_03080 [Demequina activiva]
MSTQDPFSTTPSQQGSEQGSEQTGDAAAWQPAPMPAQPEPEVRTYDYGATGYAPPQPSAPGFSGGAPTPTYGTPTPYYGAPTPTSTGTDGVSIAALVVGILGGSVIAIILGAIGLRRTAGGIRGGRGLAWAGLILGILGTIAWAITVVFLVAFVQSDEFQTGFQSGIESDFENDPFFSDAQTYGDNAELDALWDQCAAGDDGACDELYNASPIGSEYEEFGDTCGERGRPVDQLWCEQ